MITKDDFYKKDEVLMFDNFSGRVFNSDIETLRRALNNINSLEEISENELCLELGMPGAVNELPEEVNTYMHNKEDQK